MKRWLYLGGIAFSCIGLGLSIWVFAATLGGADPTIASPWLWRVQPFALAMWGLMFILPGIYGLMEDARVAEALVGQEEPPPPPRDRRARLFAKAFTAILLAIALLNFWAVLRARTDIPTPTEAERAEAFRVSRQYTIRAYSGFWLVLFGVPAVGFWVLTRELRGVNAPTDDKGAIPDGEEAAAEIRP